MKLRDSIQVNEQAELSGWSSSSSFSSSSSNPEKSRTRTRTRTRRTEDGSVLIVVLWIAIGLVSIALYFANSMTFELRAADNRASGLASEQAIEGAARYVATV